MLFNNAKQNAFLKYDVMFVEGRWYAWYIADISAPQNINDPIIMEAQKASDEAK